MNDTPGFDALSLDALLVALRGEGLAVGVREVARLQRVFALQPEVGERGGHERLRSVVRAVVAKSEEERLSVDRVLDAWVERAEWEVQAEPGERRGAYVPAWDDRWRGGSRSRKAGSWRSWRRWRPMLAVAALVALTTLLGWLELQRQLNYQPPELTPKGSTGVPPPPEPTPQLRYIALRDVQEVVQQEVTPEKPTLPFVLLSLCLLAAAGIWFYLGKRSWLPKPAPIPERKGPPRVYLTPVERGELELLEADEEEALVWGIGHYVTDQPTRRLDLAATVRATARDAGILHLQFETERFQREVWLWLDDSAEDPTLPRVADEIEAALRRHGLPVERATFYGVPERLVTVEGRAFGPREVEDRRNGALVAVLTDGRILERRYRSDSQRVKIEALLRSLSAWPRLAFVDFSGQQRGGPPRGRLEEILRPHELECLAPPQLARFLGGSPQAAESRQRDESFDYRVWAGACALAPAGVDEATAFAVRDALGLRVPAWSLRRLRVEAPGPPGRLSWPVEVRRQRINWLHDCQSEPQKGFLGRALEFWQGRYEDELARRAGGVEAAWEGVPAEQHLLLERAFGRLWFSAREGIRDLYRLFRGPLPLEVQRQLAGLGGKDWSPNEVVRMPWAVEERSAEEKVMLVEMGFGGGGVVPTLRRAGKLWLGLGVALGLAVVLMGESWREPQRPVPVISTTPWQEVTACQEDDTDGTCMSFVEIPGGTFLMGSPEEEEGASPLEQPQHEVTVSGFWMSQFETTNAQYREYLDAQPSAQEPRYWSEESLNSPTRPVVGVSWEEAEHFCRWFDGRLPTEAEWEYAARAGTTTRWSFGDDEALLGEYAWFEGNARLPEAVGQKRANPWGLYDMHGNVLEWVQDYGLAAYSEQPQIDPRGPSAGDFRVIRGGAFLNSPWVLRSAYRGRFRPGSRGDGLGFRCVRVPSRQPVGP